MQPSSQKVYKIGIRREEFSKWERRVVLVPAHCRKLLFQFKGRLQIKVQPSNIRVYPNSKYQEAGCVIDENIEDCDLILGVKQVPPSKLYKDKTYMFFSHTIKAQEHNMEMLDDILQKNIQLIDYEKITDAKGNRLVAFGVFAGNAGAIDILMGLGSFLLNRGIGSPFINISQSHHYKNIDNAKDSIRSAGWSIESNGICDLISPFIVGITGSGRCAAGSLEILCLLPHEFIEPEELPVLMKEAEKDPSKFNKQIYICQFSQKHLAALRHPNGQPFSKEHYYANPEAYVPIFEREYLQYLSLLINNIYWDDRFPRLITEAYLKEHMAAGRPLRLLAISDVTADFRGSIDFLKKFTTIDYPFFVYDPHTGAINDEYKTANSGILYCSIENHPSQFPVDASNYFSSNLIHFIPSLINSDPHKPLDQQGLCPEIRNATITHQGKLTNLFTYISKLREQKKKLEKMGAPNTEDFRVKQAKKDTINLYLEGHLFDSQAINRVFDVFVDEYHFDCIIVKWTLGKGSEKETSCVVKVVKEERFEEAFGKIKPILEEKKIVYREIEEEHTE